MHVHVTILTLPSPLKQCTILLVRFYLSLGKGLYNCTNELGLLHKAVTPIHVKLLFSMPVMIRLNLIHVTQLLQRIPTQRARKLLQAHTTT
jgi:hypothetical protein